MRILPLLLVVFSVVLSSESALAAQFIYLVDGREEFDSGRTPRTRVPNEPFGRFGSNSAPPSIFDRASMTLVSQSNGALTGSPNITFQRSSGFIEFTVDEAVEVDMNIELLSQSGTAEADLLQRPAGSTGSFSRSVLPRPLCITSLFGAVGCLPQPGELDPEVTVQETLRFVLDPAFTYSLVTESSAMDSATQFELGSARVDLTIVPEPSSALLSALGLTMLGMMRGDARRRRSSALRPRP